MMLSILLSPPRHSLDVHLSFRNLFLPFHAKVFFLDNVDIRFLSRNHNVIPRIKVFDQIYLKRMTEACASRGENDFSDFIGVSVFWCPTNAPLFNFFSQKQKPALLGSAARIGLTALASCSYVDPFA
jgi:hypothetical protein